MAEQVRKIFSFGIRKRDVNMTEGSIVRHLLLFALPLLLGNIFQQLYNMVDTWVVGNFVGSSAFSAVGSVGPITNTLIGFFTGLSSGAGAVISQYYGARREKEVGVAVHTSVMMTVFLGLLMTGIGIASIPLLLRMMQMPDDVWNDAYTYLLIYIAGLISLMLYNIGSGILRAVGDSTRPFLFLVASALINTALDLLFVVRFGMGVEGVAYATVIAETISAVLVLWSLFRSPTCVKLHWKQLKIDRATLGQIVRVGFPAGIQLAITAFSNVFVQSYINHFGKDFMGGWTAYAKIDQLILLPMQSLAVASTTFVGQNLGYGDVDRAKRGVNIAVLLSFASTLVLMIPVLIFAPQFVAFFNDDSAVIEHGAYLLHWITPFYVLCCVNQVYAGALRGSGNGRAPMFIMLFSFVLFRQVYLFVTSNVLVDEILPIAMGYPAGWVLCSIIMLIYFRKADLTKNRVVKS